MKGAMNLLLFLIVYLFCQQHCAIIPFNCHKGAFNLEDDLISYTALSALYTIKQFCPSAMR